MKSDLKIKALFFSLVSVSTIGTQPLDKKLNNAVLEGNTKKIRKLIKKEHANVNRQSIRNQETPLILAARLEKTTPYQSTRDDSKKRALADEKMTKVTEELLSLGANPTVSDMWGMTALMWAARNDARKVLKRLLQDRRVKKNINIQDNEGNTALIHAIRDSVNAPRSNFIEIIRTLLLNGADPNITNKQEKSALTYAALTNQFIIMGLLMGFDAKPTPTMKRPNISKETEEMIEGPEHVRPLGGPNTNHPYHQRDPY